MNKTITWYSQQQLEAIRNEALINHQLSESKKVLKRVPDKKDGLAKEFLLTREAKGRRSIVSDTTRLGFAPDAGFREPN